ncbi:MAG: ribosomal protein L7/L12 [Moraxellaceae bacterium]|nr:ribosomal protein L7/L12 [Moraxellaceae bacterium]
MNKPVTELPQRAIQALEGGNVIEAIKIVRADTGLGLKEAKAVVDNWNKRHPGRQSSMSQGQGPHQRELPSNTNLFAVLALVAAGIAGWMLYTGGTL